MELDILFWLAIGAIYLFQMFAGRKKPPAPGRPPVRTGPANDQSGTLTRHPGQSERPAGTATGSSTSGAGGEAPASLQDALREISDILSGKPPTAGGGESDRSGSPTVATPSRPERPPSPAPGQPARSQSRSDRARTTFKSPLKRDKESPEARAERLAKLRKKHRTHRTTPLGGERTGPPVLDENVFERRSRPPRSSTYDDLFESPLYESFGDPIEHRELKVEILEPNVPVVDALPEELGLSKDEARRGIVLSEILGPPVSKRRR